MFELCDETALVLLGYDSTCARPLSGPPQRAVTIGAAWPGLLEPSPAL